MISDMLDDAGKALSESDDTSPHEPGQCPGLDCPAAWHVGGCDPMWDYADADGYLIDPGINAYAEQDAVERRRWDGPDEPSLIEYRRGDRWEQA